MTDTALQAHSNKLRIDTLANAVRDLERTMAALRARIGELEADAENKPGTEPALAFQRYLRTAYRYD